MVPPVILLNQPVSREKFDVILYPVQNLRPLARTVYLLTKMSIQQPKTLKHHKEGKDMADKYDDLFDFYIKLYDDEIARFRGLVNDVSF